MARYTLGGKVVLITGAARGIGFATAQAALARGATVVIVDRDQDASVAAAARLHDTRALGLAADVTDRAAIARAVATTVERFGGVDVVVANAGIAPTPATMRAMSREAFDRVLDVDLHGVARTVEAALPEIVRRRGHVVVTASIYAFANGMGATPYAMAKAGVEQLGRALRVELAPHGASASVAYFGFIDTQMVQQLLADPLSERIWSLLPGPLRTRISPEVAGAAIVDGIEARRARIIRPRAWIAMSWLRGVLNPLTDAVLRRDERYQSAVRDLDARAAGEQPTTR